MSGRRPGARVRGFDLLLTRPLAGPSPEYTPAGHLLLSRRVSMSWARSVRIGAIFLGACAVYGLLQTAVDRTVSAQGRGGAAAQVPRFEVNPLWPKPLPNL